MGSGRQPASAACISLAYLVKCCVEGVLGGHTPWAITTEAGSLMLFSVAVFALTATRRARPNHECPRLHTRSGSPVRADSAAALGSLLPQLSIGLRLTHRFLVLDLSDQLALRLRERAVEVPVGGDSHQRRVAG
jgi:hypothetical protein